MEAGGEEIQLGHESLVHGDHVVLLFGQWGVVPQEAHTEKRRTDIYHSIWRCLHKNVGVCSVLHGSFLALLQPLPVFLQRTDGVPRLTTSPPQRSVSQHELRVRFYENTSENQTKPKFDFFHTCVTIWNGMNLIIIFFFVVILMKDLNTQTFVMKVLDAETSWMWRSFSHHVLLVCTHGRSWCFLGGCEEQTEVRSCMWNGQTGRPEVSLSVARLSATHVNINNSVHHYTLLFNCSALHFMYSVQNYRIIDGALHGQCLRLQG